MLTPCAGEMAYLTDGVCESSLTTVMKSLATQIVLYMTSYQILMVEELICFWSNYPQLESPTECGLLAFIDATVLLTNWSYLGHYPAEPRALGWPNSSINNTAEVPTDMLISSMCAHGQVTTAGASICKDFVSSDEVDQANHGECLQNDTSLTSSNILCVTPGSCVFSKLA